MRWRRAAIAVCATVAALAGAVTLVADAVAADQASARLAGSTGGNPATTPGTSSAYRSSLTITLDGPAESCPPAAGRSTPAPCDTTIQLPVGAPEGDVLRALGEPQTRRPFGAGGETWGYSTYLDRQHDEFASTMLTFDGHRLVDAQTYVFK